MMLSNSSAGEIPLTAHPSHEPLLKLFVAANPVERSALILAIAVMTGAVASIVYMTGGTAYPYPHLAYVPIIVASIFFGIGGGLSAGFMAGMVLGPAMPLDVATGASQASGDWIFRMVLFTMTGLGTGALAGSLRGAVRGSLAKLHTDSATGLPNREAMIQAINARHRQGQNATVVVAELSTFRSVTEAFGADVADRMTEKAAVQMRAALPQAERIYRKTADQLGVVLSTCPDRETLAKAVRRLANPVAIDGLSLPLDASLGIVPRSLPEDGAEETLQRAAISAVSASAARSGWRLHDDTAIGREQKRLHLLADARTALDVDQFLLVYQPKVRIRDGEIIGYEALARWRHPQRGMVSPGDFIPIVEHSNLIHAFSDRILDMALEQAGVWHRAGRPIPVSVNMSARDLSDDRLIDRVKTALSRHTVLPHLLDIEITESAAFTQDCNILDILHNLRDIGVSLSIDDYGTGMSSLSYLKRIPATRLKIDQYFVRNIMNDPVDRLMVGSTIALGHQLGLEVIAEGVENEETATLLLDLGCQMAQGYYYGKPQPADALTDPVPSRAVSSTYQ